MKTIFVIDPKKRKLQQKLKTILADFKCYGEILVNADRNEIKIVKVGEEEMVIKSFKVPNLLNQITYSFFRASKAKRSFLYANRLLSIGINTPFPIAYQIQKKYLLFKSSFYVSKYLKTDMTFRELTIDFEIPDHEEILRAFTRFTYQLHEKGINFLDHSPGNTLIERKNNGGYNFYLVDLNRMKFGKMNFEERMKNFSKLTIYKFMIKIMSNEYAKCSGEDENVIFEKMWSLTKNFQHKYYRKIRIKKVLFFWRKKYKSMASQSPI